MSYSPRTILVGAAVSFALTTLAGAADTDSLGIGHVASPAQIAGWDIDVRADGEGLPPGTRFRGPGELPDHRAEIAQTGLFTDVAVRNFDWEVSYDAEAYIRLLSTFSGHIADGPPM